MKNVSVQMLYEMRLIRKLQEIIPERIERHILRKHQYTVTQDI